MPLEIFVQFSFCVLIVFYVLAIALGLNHSQSILRFSAFISSVFTFVALKPSRDTDSPYMH